MQNNEAILQRQMQELQEKNDALIRSLKEIHKILLSGLGSAHAIEVHKSNGQAFYVAHSELERNK